MIKKLKARWQKWLDGTTVPVYAKPRAFNQPNFFGGVADLAAPALPRIRPVYNTAPLVLRELHQDVAVEQEVARAYAELGPIATEMLRDLDQTFAALLAEAGAARTAEQAAREGRETWRRVMTDRRSARNQERVLVDVEHLWRDDLPENERRELVVAGIKARALHASDPDAPTGLIPLTAAPYDGMSEEDTA